MRLRLLLTSALAATALSASAFAQETDPRSAGLDGGSSYGQFLAGRVAMSRGDSEAASDFFSRALAGSSGELLPRERAFSAAILAGDVRAAAAVQLNAEESNTAVIEAGRLARVVTAMIDGRPRPMNAEVRVQPIAAPHAWAGALVTRWLAADAGDWERAIAPPAENADTLTRILGGFHRALLLERRRRYDEADAQFRSLMLDGTAAAMTRLAYGEFLERRRRVDDAVALYDSGLARGFDPSLELARARAVAGDRPPAAPTIEQGAALAFTHAAAAAMVGGAHEFAVAYLQLALALDPEDGESWLTLGQALTEIGMPATAREAWARTPRGSPAYADARIALAVSLDDAGEGGEALRVAQEAASSQPSADSAYTLAALLTQHEQYEEALEVLDGPALAAIDDWNLHYLRGAANERLGRHEAAESAFQRALVHAPDQPVVLNYLGYMWIDQGARVEEGLAMVERAVAAEPDNGSYQDSLGWGRYRQGQYEEAVRLLELAVGLNPSSAEINDHLGDAYWQVGRRREAEYQWRRALTLDPDADIRTDAEAKLAGHPPGWQAR
jgi:tetratricopeptide (TPR) repeat protein